MGLWTDNVLHCELFVFLTVTKPFVATMGIVIWEHFGASGAFQLLASTTKQLWGCQTAGLKVFLTWKSLDRPTLNLKKRGNISGGRGWWSSWHLSDLCSYWSCRCQDKLQFLGAVLSYAGMVGVCLWHHIGLALPPHCAFLGCQALIVEKYLCCYHCNEMCSRELTEKWCCFTSDFSVCCGFLKIFITWTRANAQFQ